MPGKDKSESTSTVNGAADQPSFSLIAREKLLQLYSTMIKCRILEERLGLFAQRDASGAGQAPAREATLVGATIDLGRGDAIVPVRWQFLAGLAHGPLPKRAVKLPGAGSRGRGKVPSELPFDAAIRAAQIRKRKRSRKIVVVLAEAAEAEAPAWRKALALAVRQKLPIVCVLQGQGPRTARDGVAGERAEARRPRAAVKDLPAIVVDGDDAIAVYRVAYEAIARARRGLGPTLIECEPYRVENGTKSRKAGSQRDPAVEPSNRTDSLANMEAYLRGKGLFVAEARQQTTTAFAEELCRFGDAGFRG